MIKARKLFSIGLIALVVAIGVNSSLLAQSAEIYSQMKQKYPEEMAVMLQKKEKIDITIDKEGKLQINTQHLVDKLFLNDVSQAYADEYIHFGHFNEIKDIDANVFFIKGNKYSKTPVTTIETKSELSNSIFYDDNKFKHVIYPKVGKGNRAVVAYNEVIHDPHFLGAFYFTSFIPMESAEISVTLPPDVKINYRLFNDPQGKVVFSEKKEKGSTTYTWKAEGLAKFKRSLNASNAPSISYYEPHVVIYIDEYTANGKSNKVLTDVSELYKWYKGLVKNVNTKEDVTLKVIVDSLCHDAKDDTEKVKRIFYWVQDNIKYVAFEDGMSGFIPREASAVCNKRYGDCKDMASIITEMLRIARIPGKLTWIGSRAIPYTYKELPTPIVDNHMIAALKLDGQYVFLDATGQYTPFGMPTSFIQGKEALIGIDDDKFEVVKVPEIEKEKSVYRDSVTVNLADGLLKGNGYAQYTGYRKIDMVNALNDRTEEKKKEILTGVLEKGNNKFSLNEYKVKGLNDRDQHLDLSYSFDVADYAKKINNELYINLNLDKSYYNGAIEKEERDIDIEIDYRHLSRQVTVFNIPEGYKISSMPENSSFNNDKFGFEIIYRVKDNKIFLEKTIKINTLLIKTTDFDEWNKMISAISEAYNEVVVLAK